MKSWYTKWGVLVLMVGMLTIKAEKTAYASEGWENAGKALTIIEGLRVVTGGKVDVVGSVTGINRRDHDKVVYVEKDYDYTPVHYRRHNFRRNFGHHRRHHRNYCDTKVWVPHFVWKTKYIPEREEYDPDCGKTIIIEGHYARFKVEDGGHWETRCD